LWQNKGQFSKRWLSQFARLSRGSQAFAVPHISHLIANFPAGKNSKLIDIAKQWAYIGRHV